MSKKEKEIGKVVSINWRKLGPLLGGLIIGILIGIFLLHFSSAYTFDNVKNYDANTKTATIKNGLGLGGDVAELKLNTPQNVHVGLGYQKVAEFDLVYYLDDNGGLDLIDTYDLKKKSEKINRQIDYKVKTIKQVEVEDYKTIESGKLENGTSIFESVKTGTTHLEDKITWEDLDYSKLEKGETYTIGLFTNVQIGDYVEWIPTFYGVKIDEWASWTADYIEAHGITWTSGGSVSVQTGIGFLTKFNNSNEVRLHTVRKHPSDTSTKVFLLNSDKSINKSMTWSGVEATADVELLNNTQYYLIVNASGASYTRYGNADTAQVSGTTVNWNCGIVGGTYDCTGNINPYGIVNITLQLENGDNPPTVTLNSPIDYYNQTTTDGIVFNCTASDDINLTNVAFSINEMSPDVIVNYVTASNSSGINNSNYIFTESYATIGEGTFNWTCIATDNNSQSNTPDYRYFTIDTTPFIEFVTPPTLVNYANITQEYIPMKVNVSTDVFKNITYSLRNVNGTNYTQFYTNETYDINFTNMPDAHYHYDVTICTTTDKCNVTETRHVNHDNTGPSINVSSPVGTYSYLYEDYNLTLNYTVTDIHLDSCWFGYNNVNTSLVCSNATLNTTYFNYTKDVNNLTFYSNDTFGNENSSVVAINYRILKNSQTFTNPITEGVTDTFSLNVKTNGTDITAAKLNYNGTNYTASVNDHGSNNFTISKALTIPLVSADSNLTFFWYLLQNNYVQTVPTTQTVYNFGIDDCTVNGITLYNFTIKSETNQTKLVGTTGKVDASITVGSTEIAQYNFSSTDNPFALCINKTPSAGESFNFTAVVGYTSTGYATKFYNFQNSTINSSALNQNISLYDINSTKNQVFRLIVKDSSFLSIPNALVEVWRKYIDEGTFKIVEIPQTDAQGNALANLVVNDVIYNFVIKRNGVTLSTYNNVRPVCQTPSITECTIDFNAFSTQVAIPDYENGNDFQYTLGYNSSSQTISSAFSIPSGITSLVYLNVTREDALGTAICTDSITSSSGTLSCIVPASFGNSTVLAKLYKDSELVSQGEVKINQTPSDIYGGIVIFLALFVMLSLLGVGMSDNPILTTVFLILGIIVLFAMNLVANNGFIGGTATILWVIMAAVIVLIKGARRT